jgi:hypothetical protein
MCGALLLISGLVAALHTAPERVPDLVKHAGGWLGRAQLLLAAACDSSRQSEGAWRGVAACGPPV